jgi:hypothetical protein
VRLESLRRARRYARWVDVAARHHIVGMHCLQRSLALHQWLRSNGLPSELRIGVRREGPALRAHAWVELGGYPLNEQPSALSLFTPIYVDRPDLPAGNHWLAIRLAGATP